MADSTIFRTYNTSHIEFRLAIIVELISPQARAW